MSLFYGDTQLRDDFENRQVLLSGHFCHNGLCLFFFIHYKAFTHWTIWLPWISLALFNPWIEEFYYRGFLLDNTTKQNLKVILFSVFSIMLFWYNSEVNKAYYSYLNFDIGFRFGNRIQKDQKFEMVAIRTFFG